MYWMLALGVFRMLSSKKLYNVRKDLMGTFNWGLLNSLQGNTFINVLVQKKMLLQKMYLLLVLASLSYLNSFLNVQFF